MAAFEHAVRTEEELRSLVPERTPNSAEKDIDVLDEHCRTLIAHSPLVLVATAAADGTCDVSPRGGDPGWVTVLDERRLVLPDAPGNRRLDSFANVLSNPHVGLLFLIPQRDETLRVNGRATITTDPDLLATLTLHGRTPPMALGVEVEQVFTHCGKALMRSSMWSPEGWPDVSEIPSFAQILRDHVGRPERSVEQVAAMIDESYTTRMW